MREQLSEKEKKEFREKLKKVEEGLVVGRKILRHDEKILAALQKVAKSKHS